MLFSTYDTTVYVVLTISGSFTVWYEPLQKYSEWFPTAPTANYLDTLKSNRVKLNWKGTIDVYKRDKTDDLSTKSLVILIDFDMKYLGLWVSITAVSF